MTAVVEARSLDKSYGSQTALSGVDLSVAEGEVYGLVGPNGAGKTTLVRCLTGTTEPSAGEARVLDVSPTDVDRSRLGLLPQEFRPEDRLTPTELVSYYSGLYPSDRVRETGALLQEVGLEDAASQRYRELSGGQKRRLLVAVSIANDPDVLFLDEPTTGIDPKGRRDVWRVVERLSDAGTTVFLTTHYMEEASHLSDRVGLLHDGGLVESGSPSELVEIHGGRPNLVMEIEDGAEAVADALDDHEVSFVDGEAVVEDVALEDVSGVLELLRSADVDVSEMNWRKPDLEDVYMKLADEEVELGGTDG